MYNFFPETVVTKMSLKFSHMNLRTKILIASLLSTILPLLLLGFFIYTYVTNLMKEDLSINELDSLTTLNTQLDYFLADVEQMSLFFYKNNDIQEILRKDEGRSAEDKHSDYEIVNDIFNTATGVKQWDVNIYVIGLNGDRYFTTNYLPPEYHNIRDYWGIFRKMHEENGNITWDSNYYIKKLDKKEVVLTAGRLIIDNQTNQPLGYVLIDINEVAFSNMYGEYIDRNDTFYILEEQGYIVSSYPNKEMVGLKLEEPFLHKVLTNQKGFQNYKHKNESSILTYHTSDETNLRMVNIKPTTTIVQKNSLIRKLTFNFALIGIIVSIWLAYYLSRTITMPLYKLMHLMGEVEKGKLNVRFNQRYEDDIGLFGKQFNNMLSKLEILIQESYEKQIRLRDSEIKALQAQINPHFLYNTLDTINWMARLKGVNDISSIVVSLSEIMRYAVKKDKDLVTIAEDIEQLKNYITIQKYRFADKFDVEVIIDDQVKNELIPPLLIQPLVENAIIHGMEPTLDTGIIEVSVKQIDKNIDIIIKDSGVGMNPELVQLANEPLDDELFTNSEGIGLTNVRKRLQLFYGENYFWELKSVINQGTTIHIKIPYKEGY